ncbi:hypothetical protein Dsin_008833 [Dipteronia sinensis]|uniref:Uncharacterized protein n=1 Tax=Dipteronia sinensis TaxID=43782 RepID=A0AAE0APX5_9ROSI|nr:hypothetical protein Dsin_008833 [Dipteronia sinensis]
MAQARPVHSDPPPPQQQQHEQQQEVVEEEESSLPDTADFSLGIADSVLDRRGAHRESVVSLE